MSSFTHKLELYISSNTIYTSRCCFEWTRDDIFGVCVCMRACVWSWWFNDMQKGKNETKTVPPATHHFADHCFVTQTHAQHRLALKSKINACFVAMNLNLRRTTYKTLYTLTMVARKKLLQKWFTLWMHMEMKWIACTSSSTSSSHHHHRHIALFGANGQLYLLTFEIFQYAFAYSGIPLSHSHIFLSL